MSTSPSWAAVAAGAIGLAVLDGVVSRQQAASNVGGWIAGAGKAVEWFLSPAVPAFKVTAAPASSSAQKAIVAGPASSVTPPGSSASNQPYAYAGFPGESAQTQAQGGAV